MNQLKGILKQTTTQLEEQCSECGTNLVRFKFGKHDRTLCPKCTKEKHQQENEELEKQWTEESLKAKAWNYFNYNSLFNNEGLLDAGFKNFDTSEPQVEAAKEKSISFIKSVMNGENPHLILSGKSGTGKSHLSMAVVRSLIEMSKYQKKVLFVHYATLLEHIRKSFDEPDLKVEVNRLMGEVVNCDVLVLDDLGVDLGQTEDPERASRFNIEKLNLILERRENKPLIVTTNLTDSQIANSYGSRNHSRIFNHSKGFRVKMDDVKDKRLR